MLTISVVCADRVVNCYQESAVVCESSSCILRLYNVTGDSLTRPAIYISTYIHK